MTGRRWPRALAVLGPLAVAACTALTGLDDLAVAPPVADSGPDVTDVLPDGGDFTEASVSPSDAGTDATFDAEAGPICVPAVLDPSGPSHATHLTSALAIDGDLGDWPCAAFTSMDVHSAQRAEGTPEWPVQFAVGWDASGIYFGCQVFDPHPEGTAIPSQPYYDDACELYVGTAPPLDNGAFRPGDIHYIIDFKDQARSFGINTNNPMPAAVVHKTSVTSSGFVVEMFVPTSLLGFTPSAGTALLFDAQIDDTHDGMAQAGILWAYAEPVDSGLCASGRYEPACDTRPWGGLTLSP